MKKLIYISGPITDNKTGLPREGWQQDFLDAEAKLRRMGFEVVTPVNFVKEIEKEWNKRIVGPLERGNPPRWFYLHGCLSEIASRIMVEGMLKPLMEKLGTSRFTGLYVIGDMADISMSYGTMCEINFAMAAGLPVWSQYYNGYQMTNMLMQKCDGPTLAEVK